MKLTEWKSGLPSLPGEYDILHFWPGNVEDQFVLRHYFNGEKFEGAVRVRDGVPQFFSYSEACGDMWRGLAEDPNGGAA